MLEPLTRRDLLAQGRTVREIAAAVHDGELIRARRNQYLPRSAPVELVQAVRIGGPLACLSELRARGIWVIDDGRLHVHLPANASRLRDPDDRSASFLARSGVRLHWRDLRDPVHAGRGHVSVVDALLQASRCLPADHLLASLDSAARLGLLRRRHLLEQDAVVGPLLCRVDTSAASGLETIVRELARRLGFRVASQVPIDGVGWVDLVIEEWIVVETDGSSFHRGDAARRDYRRDAAIAATGKTPLRFSYAQVVHEPSAVARSLIGAVAAHRRVRNSGQKVRIAQRRAASAGLA